MQQYELDTFGRSHDVMSNFWNSCFDDLMSTAFKRDKDRSDSKSKFQVGNIFPGFSLRPFAEHFKLGLQLIRPVSRVGVQTGNGGGSLSEESEK